MVVIDELDEEGLAAKARQALVNQHEIDPNANQLIEKFSEYRCLKPGNGVLEEGVYKNMTLKENWIMQMRGGTQASISGTHTLSFRNVTFNINGKKQLLESPKVLKQKGYGIKEVWEAFTEILDRDLLMTKFENLSNKKENNFSRIGFRIR